MKKDRVPYPCKNCGRRIGNVHSSNRLRSVPRCLLENGGGRRKIGSGEQSLPPGQTAGNIRDNVPVQIWHYHNVELLRLGSHLHARIVYNHVVKFNVRVPRSNLPATLEEEPVALLHDVGLVYCGNLLAIVPLCILECILRDSNRFLARYDLQAFHNTRNSFMFKARVFTLCILANDNHINSRVARLHPGNIFTVHDVREKIKGCPQDDIDRLRL
mmetsp:Transcript_40832/g.161742  ORF Transcript_40832/g.161742 Transcript_40832/m.161742 type:complete len:215 (+) Transcript_40832:1299-1943(+)